MTTADFDTLLLSDPNRGRSTSHIFIAHPSPLEEHALGKLFLLVDIEDRQRVSHDVISTIQEELKTAYYHAASFSIEVAFEQALQAVNQQLYHLIEGGVTDWLTRTNLVAGVVKDQFLVFTALGRVHGFFFRGSRATDIIDPGSIREKVNPLKVFTAISTGQLADGDHLLFTTSTLLDYFSPEKLRRLIQETPPHAVVNAIEDALVNRPPESTFVSLILRSTKAVDVATPTTLTTRHAALEQPQSSMADLIAKQQATDALLSSSFRRSLVSGLRGFGHLLENVVLRRLILRKPPRRRMAVTQPTVSALTSQTRERFQQEPRPIARTGLRVARRLGLALLAGVFMLLRALVRFVQNPRGLTRATRRVPERTSSIVERPLHWFQRLSWRQRGVVLAGIVLLFILAQSVVSLGEQRQNALSASEREAIVADVRTKATDAEAALSYGNEQAARDLLTQAQEQIAKLPAKRKADKAIVAELTSSFDQIRTQLRHIVQIDQPTLLADLGPASASANPRALAVVGTSIVALDGDANRLFVVNADGQASPVDLDGGAVGSPRRLIPESRSSVLIVGTDGILRFSLLTEKATPVTLTRAASGESVQDAALYADRLYVLASAENQVFRHPGAAQTFGTPASWLRDAAASVTSDAAIAVDGSVYTLAADGTIHEYSQGRAVAFAPATPDPAWKNPALLWTAEDVDDLYVADPSERRVVRLSKRGAIVAQYVSPAFDDLRAFAVNVESDQLLVVSGTKVFQVPLTTP